MCVNAVESTGSRTPIDSVEEYEPEMDSEGRAFLFCLQIPKRQNLAIIRC